MSKRNSRVTNSKQKRFNSINRDKNDIDKSNCKTRNTNVNSMNLLQGDIKSPIIKDGIESSVNKFEDLCERCFECKINFPVNENTAKCFQCDNYFHPVCLDLHIIDQFSKCRIYIKNNSVSNTSNISSINSNPSNESVLNSIKFGNICSKCDTQFKSNEKTVQCHQCKNSFHPTCVELDKTNVPDLISILCDSCSENIEKDDLGDLHGNKFYVKSKRTNIKENDHFNLKQKENSADAIKLLELNQLSEDNTCSSSNILNLTLGTNLKSMPLFELMSERLDSQQKLINVLSDKLDIFQKLLQEKTTMIIMQENKIKILSKLQSQMNKNIQTTKVTEIATNDKQLLLNELLLKINALEKEISALTKLHDDLHVKIKSLDHSVSAIKIADINKINEPSLNKNKLSYAQIVSYGKNTLSSSSSQDNNLKFKIKVVNIKSQVEIDTIKTKLIQSNSFFNDHNFEIAEIIKTNTIHINTSCNFTLIINTNYTLWKFLINNCILIDGNQHRCFEHLKLKQCYNCWSFEHIKDECTNNIKCKVCSGDHHHTQCSNDDKPKCSNCVEQPGCNNKHRSTYGGCISRLQYIEILKAKWHLTNVN